MRKNIFLTYMIVVLVSLSITGIITVNAVEKYFKKSTEDMLLTNAKMTQRIIFGELKDRDSDLQKTVVDLSLDLGIRLTVIDMKGNILADSEKPDIMENHMERPEIKTAYSGKVGKSIRYSTTLKTKMMYLAVPLEKENTSTGVLRLSIPLSEIKNLSQFIWGVILSSTFIGFIIAFFMSTFFTISLTKPIGNLAKAAQEIARGNYEMQINTKAPGEVKILADAFNDMAENLKVTVRELTDGKQKTDAILGSMADSLIAVDQQCNLVMINSAAQKLFNISSNEAIGKHILEIIRNKELYDSIKEVLTGKDVLYKEIKILNPEENIFRVHMAPIVGTETFGVVAVLRNISDLRRLEKMRTEFVANVSHELKTPLTSISGFVETLLDGAYEDKEHCTYFLEIIKEETDRMTRLINDLLYISRIENLHEPIQKSEVDIVDTVTKALSVLQEQIDEKQHTVHVDIPKNIKPIVSDKDSLVQILINLVDNAVKYTPPGGKISIKAEEEDDRDISISIADNGIGISQEALSRIFERFYRIDKSRSNIIEGTGLGLSVVKHLTKGLGGKIDVKSEYGNGTVFTVKLPKVI